MIYIAFVSLQAPPLSRSSAFSLATTQQVRKDPNASILEVTSASDCNWHTADLYKEALLNLAAGRYGLPKRSQMIS